MSTAYLVTGVLLSDILKKEKEQKTIRRFHEITGEPYEKSEQRIFWTLCGREINPTEDPERYPEEVKELKGIKSFLAGCSEDIQDHICGELIAAVDDCNGSTKEGLRLKECTGEMVTDATQKAFEKLSRIGYTGGVGIYLVMRESY